MYTFYSQFSTRTDRKSMAKRAGCSKTPLFFVLKISFIQWGINETITRLSRKFEENRTSGRFYFFKQKKEHKKWNPLYYPDKWRQGKNEREEWIELASHPILRQKTWMRTPPVQSWHRQCWLAAAWCTLLSQADCQDRAGRRCYYHNWTQDHQLQIMRKKKRISGCSPEERNVIYFFIMRAFNLHHKSVEDNQMTG